MKKARTYDFDLMTSCISDALGMDLEYERCSNFIIDKSSAKDPIDCDRYFESEIIRMLDKLPYEAVKACIYVPYLYVPGLYRRTLKIKRNSHHT